MVPSLPRAREASPNLRRHFYFFLHSLFPIRELLIISLLAIASFGKCVCGYSVVNEQIQTLLNVFAAVSA